MAKKRARRKIEHGYKLVNPADRQRFLVELAECGSRHKAATICGVTYSAICKLCVRDEEFRLACREADKKFMGSAEAKLVEHVKSGDFAALKFLLERKFWKRWGARRADAWTARDISKFALAVVADLKKSLPEEHHPAVADAIDRVVNLVFLGAGVKDV